MKDLVLFCKMIGKRRYFLILVFVRERIIWFCLRNVKLLMEIFNIEIIDGLFIMIFCLMEF